MTRAEEVDVEFACEQCGEAFTPADPVCSCGAHCPMCRALYCEPCEHLVADPGVPDAWQEGEVWEVSPFAGMELPVLRQRKGKARAWSADEKATVFGSLLPLLAAYEDEHVVYSGGDENEGEDDGNSEQWVAGLQWPPDEHRLFELLVPLLSVRVQKVTWVSDSPASDEGTIYLATDPDQARQELRALLKQLSDGFARLESLHGGARAGVARRVATQERGRPKTIDRSPRSTNGWWSCTQGTRSAAGCAEQDDAHRRARAREPRGVPGQDPVGNRAGRVDASAPVIDCSCIGSPSLAGRNS
jgi:hypothetical protein